MVRRLADGVWLLPLRISNAYLLEDDVLTLVDAGLPWDANRLRHGLDVLGQEPSDVQRILLTHYDVDHVGTLGRLPFDAPIYARDPDASYLEGSGKPPWTNHKGAFQRLADVAVRHPDLDVRRVDDGDAVGSFDVHATPGHTPGHTAFVSEELDVAAVGDLVREEDGRLVSSPWAMSYDTAAVRASIDRLARDAAPFSVVAIGHGEPPTEGGRELFRRLADR
jgi:glyoxylase-like metal-dependent hydrolase (beta-lactamase superfamily II)